MTGALYRTVLPTIHACFAILTRKWLIKAIILCALKLGTINIEMNIYTVNIVNNEFRY